MPPFPADGPEPVALARAFLGDGARDIAAALIVTEDDRYLLQLRDDFPHILLPAHWALFGGGIEPGETAEAGLRREVEEELGYRPGAVQHLVDAGYRLPAAGRLLRISFFIVPVRRREIDDMVQTEGAGKGLFTIDEAVRLDRISPWDLSAMMLHARWRAMFGSLEDGGQ